MDVRKNPNLDTKQELLEDYISASTALSRRIYHIRRREGHVDASKTVQKLGEHCYKAYQRYNPTDPVDHETFIAEYVSEDYEPQVINYL